MTNNNECDVIATIKLLDLTENIQEEIQLNDLNSEKSVEVVKNKGGRPRTIEGLNFNKDDLTNYHNQYYHIKRSIDVICECGALVKAGCLTRHKKRQIHIRRLIKITQ